MRGDPELKPLLEQLDARVEALSAHARRDEGATLTQAEVAQASSELSQLMSALAVGLARKELNFEAAVARPTAEETTASVGPWRRMLRLLASERFCKDLGLVQKPLSYVVTALLLVTLLGWTAEPLANSWR